ncbi:MAG: hypothetical protein ITG02_00845 [Patulibacter sp.]|nr:hypothetical protein [Patulibacter sp.]
MTRKRNAPKGHRYRQVNTPMDGNKIRVRGKRLDQVDDTKLALAFWILARQIAEDKTDPRQLNEKEVRKLADRLENEERSLTGDDSTGNGGTS